MWGNTSPRSSPLTTAYASRALLALRSSRRDEATVATAIKADTPMLPVGRNAKHATRAKPAPATLSPAKAVVSADFKARARLAASTAVNALRGATPSMINPRSAKCAQKAFTKKRQRRRPTRANLARMGMVLSQPPKSAPSVLPVGTKKTATRLASPVWRAVAGSTRQQAARRRAPNARRVGSRRIPAKIGAMANAPVANSPQTQLPYPIPSAKTAGWAHIPTRRAMGHARNALQAVPTLTRARRETRSTRATSAARMKSSRRQAARHARRAPLAFPSTTRAPTRIATTATTSARLTATLPSMVGAEANPPTLAEASTVAEALHRP